MARTMARTKTASTTATTTTMVPTTTTSTTTTTAMPITEMEAEVKEARVEERSHGPIECAAVAQYNVRPNTMSGGVELDMEKQTRHPSITIPLYVELFKQSKS